VYFVFVCARTYCLCSPKSFVRNLISLNLGIQYMISNILHEGSSWIICSFLGFEVLIVVVIKNSVFLGITPCSPDYIDFSPEDRTLHNHRCENLKSYTLYGEATHQYVRQFGLHGILSLSVAFVEKCKIMWRLFKPCL
jgi:hypothetical protein